MSSKDGTNSDHPDSHLFPHATGAAAKTVEAHSAEQPLKLYAGWFCPFVQRVWLVLEEKKIPYQYIEVNPYHKLQSLLDLNPRGLVPTLQYQGEPLYESTVLLEFIEEAFPNHTPNLLPKDVYARARARIWSDFVTSRIIGSFHRLLQFQPVSNTQGLEAARDELTGKLKEWAAEISDEGPYFLGPEPTLPDFVLAPWAVRLWILSHFKSGLGIPAENSPGDDRTWAKWRRWLNAIESRKSVLETTSEMEHYMPIYKRYAENTAQSELAKATRAGRGVP